MWLLLSQLTNYYLALIVDLFTVMCRKSNKSKITREQTAVLYRNSVQLLQPHVYEAALVLSPSSLALHKLLAPLLSLPAFLHHKITTNLLSTFVHKPTVPKSLQRGLDPWKQYTFGN